MPQSAVYPINPPAAHRIADEAEALRVAEQVAAILLEQDAERDRTRQVPAEIVDLYSSSGLWGITVPEAFGGAQVSSAVLAQVIAIISAADPSLGQIPQNHYCLLEDIRLQGTPQQQAHFSAWPCKATGLPMPCRKPAAKTCRTSRRPFAVTVTAM